MQTTEEQQAYDAVYRYAHEQMAQGVSDERIQRALVAQGWEPAVARAITENLRAPAPQEPDHGQEAYGREDYGRPAVPVDVRPTASPKRSVRAPTVYTPTAKPQVSKGGGGGGGSSGGRDVLIGAVVCVIGLAITFGTYAAASSGSGGGRYTVAWGAIVFGAIQFFKGLAKMGTGD